MAILFFLNSLVGTHRHHGPRGYGTGNAVLTVKALADNTDQQVINRQNARVI